MMADGTHVTNACMCVLMLGMGTVLLTMLLKYYSTIPFVNRNTVTYLLTFIFCIIFGIIIIQSTSMFIFSTYGAVNHSSAVFFRASWCLALLLFDLTVITVCIFRQLIIIKPVWFCNLNHEKMFHWLVFIIGSSSAMFVLGDYYYTYSKHGALSLHKMEAFLMETSFDLKKWNTIFPATSISLKLIASFLIFFSSLYNQLNFLKKTGTNNSPKFKMTISFKTFYLIFGLQLLISGSIQAVIFLKGRSRYDIFYTFYNVNLIAILMLLAFLMTDEEAKKYLSRRYKGLKERWRSHRRPRQISPAAFHPVKRDNQEGRENNANGFNNICVIELD